MSLTDSRNISELFDLSDEVALITGATGQLGRAICEALAEQGCKIVLNARTRTDCQELQREFSEMGVSAMAAPGDVTNPKDLTSIIETTMDSFGQLDILVNNAYSGHSKSFENTTKEEFRSGLESGITSAFLCIREALPHLLENEGRVINISSIYGVVAPDHSIYGNTGLNNPVYYGIAKAGLIQLTRWVATRYASEGLRANCLVPGGFYNPKFESDPEYKEVFVPNYEEKTPLGRMGVPEDIKGCIAFLASDASSWMTGQKLVIDGGWTTW